MPIRSPATAPRQVLLFSGHMVDTPGRPVARFPMSLVPAAQRAIDDMLDELGAGASDLAIAQAAAGGDLLFLEACLRRGVALQVMLPMPPQAFVDHSVRPSADGPAWADRFDRLVDGLARPPLLLPAAAPDDASDLYERANRWMLEAALVHGAERVRFVCLWDGGGGDGPGGTRHMMEEVRRRHGSVHWIDLRRLAGAPSA